MARLNYRKEAVRLLQAAEVDPRLVALPLTESLYERGLRLFAARMDKEWGLIDCVSFEVMAERKIEQALTADKHFVQAGFVALLLSE